MKLHKVQQQYQTTHKIATSVGRALSSVLFPLPFTPGFQTASPHRWSSPPAEHLSRVPSWSRVSARAETHIHWANRQLFFCRFDVETAFIPKNISKNHSSAPWLQISCAPSHARSGPFVLYALLHKNNSYHNWSTRTRSCPLLVVCLRSIVIAPSNFVSNAIFVPLSLRKWTRSHTYMRQHRGICLSRHLRIPPVPFRFLSLAEVSSWKTIRPTRYK